MIVKLPTKAQKKESPQTNLCLDGEFHRQTVFSEDGNFLTFAKGVGYYWVQNFHWVDYNKCKRQFEIFKNWCIDVDCGVIKKYGSTKELIKRLQRK
jgi:hypothetical protein